MPERQTEAPLPGIWTARRRLAAAMRLVIERLTASDAPEAELRRAAERLEDYAAHLSSHGKRDRYIGFAESALADPAETPDEAGATGAGATQTPVGAVGTLTAELSAAPHSQRAGGHFDYSPLIGRSNPLAPPVIMHADADGTVHGRVTFGSAYEGPPGCVHGGLVAAAFDEVLGYAQIFSGRPGMTGKLEVSYRAPTPLHRELRFTARVDRREGRKVFVQCQLRAGDQLCAEATGLFISMRPGTLDRLMKSRRPGPTNEAEDESE